MESVWKKIVAGFVFATLWARASSLSVTSGSRCESDCDIAGGHTVEDDLICSDSYYDNLGSTMRNCLACESGSTEYHNSTDNDVWWLLYNQKYTIQHCLFEGSRESLPSCESQCLPLKSVITERYWPDRSKPPTHELYDYCTMENGAFMTNWKGCANCLRGKDESYVLGNFLATMASACRTKPNPSDGETVDIPQPLFMTKPLPSSTSATRSSTATATATPTETSTNSDSSADSSTGSSLSPGASAGVGVGVGVGVILLALVGWFFFRRHRNQQQLQPQYGEMLQSPQYPAQEGFYNDAKHDSPQSYFPPTPIHEAGSTPRAELHGGYSH